MFTGIILERSEVLLVSERLQVSGQKKIFYFEVGATHTEFSTSKLGDSVAVNGACMTIVTLESGVNYKKIGFEVSLESLKRTGLNQLAKGDLVNLESSLRLGNRIDGHLVSGHVDGMGEIREIKNLSDGCSQILIRVSNDNLYKLAPFLVEKGSIAVNGVSLTINEIKDFDFYSEFLLCIIPHTLKITNLEFLKPGDIVNLEADLMAKQFLRYGDFQKKHESKKVQEKTSL